MPDTPFAIPAIRNWRLISRFDGSEYTEEILYHQAGLDGRGGASDVDSVIMRRTFLTTGSPQTEDNRYYILQNWRQDPAVTVTDAGVQVERAHFSPYGRVLGMPAGDTDFDFAFDSDDQTTLSGWSGAYRAHADVDLDGDVDSDDATAQSNVAMGWDVLSHVGSKIGYAGRTYDALIPVLVHMTSWGGYHVGLGRLIHREGAVGIGGGGASVQPCYGPCCEVGAGDSRPDGCSRGGGPVIGPNPDPPDDHSECGGGESVDDVWRRCMDAPGFGNAFRMVLRACIDSGQRTGFKLRCKECDDPRVGGRFSCKRQDITLCKKTGQRVSCSVLIHEMIHLADYCDGLRDCTDCKENICTEARAYARDQRCCFESTENGFRACVKRRMRFSLGDCWCEEVADLCIPSRSAACEIGGGPLHPGPPPIDRISEIDCDVHAGE